MGRRHPRRRRLLGQAVEELFQEPGLAGPGRCDQAHQPRPALGERPPRHQLQLFEVGLPPHQRRPGRRPGGPGTSAQHLPGTHRRRLPARLDQALRPELEPGGGGVGGSQGRQDLPGLGRLLDAGGNVDRISSDQEIGRGQVAAGDYLAGGQAEPDREPSEAVVGAHPVAERERSCHRALGVIAVRGRQAENGHHRIADELFESPAVVGHDGFRDLVVASEQGPDLLRVQLLAERRRAGDIGEENGDDPPLLGHSPAEA